MEKKGKKSSTSSRSSTFLAVGEDYFFRTVTHYYTGRILALEGDEILLEKAAWIPDTGRFSKAMKDFEFAAVEPYPENRTVVLFRQALVDAMLWAGPLPRARKP